jgi:hypothetical protein
MGNADKVATAERNVRLLIAEALEQNPSLYGVARREAPVWYLEAHKLAVSFISPELNLAQASGIVAAFSTNTTWAANVTLAKRLVAGNPAGLPDVLKKIAGIMALDNPSMAEVQLILNGLKLQCFADNIAHPTSSHRSTLDRWMYLAMGVPKTKSAELYGEYEDMFARLAVEYGFELPMHFQAFIWVLKRGKAY